MCQCEGIAARMFGLGRIWNVAASSLLHQSLVVVNPHSDPVVKPGGSAQREAHSTPAPPLLSCWMVFADGFYHTTLGRG